MSLRISKSTAPAGFVKITLRHTSLLALAAFIGVTATSTAKATDFVINTPVVVTNGGNVVDGDDSITVTNSGSITGAIGGIDASGGNNTIVNDGTISTTGNNNEGIRANDDNTITNSGSISTTGNYAEGIDAENDNIITNSGTITTTGNGAEGIQADDDNTITNSGTITTTGDYAEGIDADDDNIISNSGLISTTGDYAEGIQVDDDSIVSNSGTITTTGDYSEGIYGDDDNTITNSGTITTAGINSEGIVVADDSIVTNSGKVVAAQSDAFSFGTDNTLNLQAPAFVGGAFNLGDNTTLNIQTGPSHSILWTFDPTQLAGGVPNISGSVPVFMRLVSATELQVATYDPTSLAGSFDMLAGTTGLLSDLMARRLSGGSGVSGSTNSFVFSDQSANLNKVEPVAGHFGAGQGRAWLSAFGSQFDYDSTSTSVDSDLDSWGLAAGYDWMMSDDLKLGLLAGYMNSTLKAKSNFATSYDNDTSNFFAGVYGRKGFGAGFLNFAVTTGFSKTDQKRFVNNNLAPLGVSYAKSDYSGYWVSPELTLGTQFDVAHGWQAIPSLKLRYASQWLKGYSESGSASNAKVGSRHVAIGEASVDLAVQRKIDIATATLNIGYLYRASMGDKKTSITMIGQSQSVKNSAKDRRAIYIGAAVNMNVYDNLNLDLSARGDFGKNYSGYAATATLSASF